MLFLLESFDDFLRSLLHYWLLELQIANLWLKFDLKHETMLESFSKFKADFEAGLMTIDNNLCFKWKADGWHFRLF